MEGYTIGAGIETLLSEHVSAKLEYRGTFWSLDERLGDDDMGLLAYSDAYVQTIHGTLSVRLGNWSGAALPDGSFGGQPYNWTGVHFGGGAGYGTNSQTVGVEIHDYNPGGLIQIGGPTGFDIFSLGNSIDLGGRGAIGTIEGGFDVQLGNHFVFGFLSDYTWSNINANYSVFGDVCYEPTDCDPPDPIISDRPVLALDVTTGNNWSIGGRSGVSVGSRTLIYGLGAYTRTTMTVLASLESIPTGPDPIPFGGGPITRHGYTFGTGVETMLAPNLSAKLEYRGTMWTAMAETGDDVQGFTAFASNFVQTIRGTLSLRFGVGP